MDGAADQVVRTGSPAERGCCRPQRSVYIYADLNETLAESADRTVRTSFPTIGRYCGLCGEKEHFPAEREREKLYYQPALDIESRNGEDPRPA